MERKKLKNFLELFDYADDDKKKTETISYILDVLERSETEGSVLEFEKLEDITFNPNPLLDHHGRVMFNTKTFISFYNDYVNRVKYVKSEIANLVRQDYLIMRDISQTSLEDFGKTEK